MCFYIKLYSYLRKENLEHFEQDDDAILQLFSYLKSGKIKMIVLLMNVFVTKCVSCFLVD
jgi:hypothetical protein